jgi:hypothetical protein
MRSATANALPPTGAQDAGGGSMAIAPAGVGLGWCADQSYARGLTILVSNPARLIVFPLLVSHNPLRPSGTQRPSSERDVSQSTGPRHCRHVLTSLHRE